MSFFTKFLVFILGLAVLGVAAAWIMGGESTKNSTRISVKARPSTVFSYLVDGEKIKQWGKDVVSAGTFENEDSMSQERVVLDEGKEIVWQDSLMRFQPGKTVSIQSRQGGLTRTLVFNLDENEIGGTRCASSSSTSSRLPPVRVCSAADHRLQAPPVAWVSYSQLRSLFRRPRDPTLAALTLVAWSTSDWKL